MSLINIKQDSELTVDTSVFKCVVRWNNRLQSASNCDTVRLASYNKGASYRKTTSLAVVKLSCCGPSLGGGISVKVASARMARERQ
jgi:hypothetical protein